MKPFAFLGLLFIGFLSSCDMHPLSPESTAPLPNQSIFENRERSTHPIAVTTTPLPVTFVPTKPDLLRFRDQEHFISTSDQLALTAQKNNTPLEIHISLARYLKVSAYEDVTPAGELALVNSAGEVMIGDSILQLAGDYTLIKSKTGKIERVFAFLEQRDYVFPITGDQKPLSGASKRSTHLLDDNPCGSGSNLDRCVRSPQTIFVFDMLGVQHEVAAIAYHDAYRTAWRSRRSKARTKIISRENGSGPWYEVTGSRFPGSWVKVTLYNKQHGNCEIHNAALKASASTSGKIRVLASNGRDRRHGVSWSQHTAYLNIPGSSPWFAFYDYRLEGADAYCDPSWGGSHWPY